ncbi:FliM/FliN family flagellar motor switch protein [Albidovulum sp.]|uniref:FliM/FliN family flagellar motor switch protein n=1 Tax=Albidovulum sp. TaxID=1872424 RepID=UPI0039B85BB5
MATTASDTVLKRKAEAGRGHAGGAPPTPPRAFGHAVAKAGQDMFHLPVAVTEAVEFRASLADLPERLVERALLAVMEGPGGGLGLVALSPEVLTTLIEMQTTKRIGAAEVAARRPTRTDAAMSVRFIDRVMEELGLLRAADPSVVWAGGFRYGSFLDDPRPLGLLLEDTVYRVLRLTLGLGAEGARRGTLLFAMPAEGRGAMPRPAAGAAAAGVAAGAEAATPGPADWAGRMERAVLGARAGIDAVLDRISLPLSAVMAFAPGTVLPITAGALAGVRIEGQGRRLLATGRLGQCQGNLALRLNGGAEAAGPCGAEAAGPCGAEAEGTGAGPAGAAGRLFQGATAPSARAAATRGAPADGVPAEEAPASTGAAGVSAGAGAAEAGR